MLRNLNGQARLGSLPGLLAFGHALFVYAMIDPSCLCNKVSPKPTRTCFGGLPGSSTHGGSWRVAHQQGLGTHACLCIILPVSFVLYHKLVNVSVSLSSVRFTELRETTETHRGDYGNPNVQLVYQKHK